MSSVFLAQPNYNGTLEHGAAESVYATASKTRDIHLMQNPMSLVSHNCNHLYANALNVRETLDVEWFAVLHSDIGVSQYWIDTLIHEAEENAADMISAFVPIKDARGRTSTAIYNPANPWTPATRITQKQKNHTRFPKTADINGVVDALENLPPGLRVEGLPRVALQVNTGCCLIRLNAPWSHQLYFDQLDRIFHDGVKYRAKTQSEDWRISLRVAQLGGKVCVTKAVNTMHYGFAAFDSTQSWGDETDTDCLKGSPDEEPEIASIGR